MEWQTLIMIAILGVVVALFLFREQATKIVETATSALPTEIKVGLPTEIKVGLPEFNLSGLGAGLSDLASAFGDAYGSTINAFKEAGDKAKETVETVTNTAKETVDGVISGTKETVKPVTEFPAYQLYHAGWSWKKVGEINDALYKVTTKPFVDVLFPKGGQKMVELVGEAKSDVVKALFFPKGGQKMVELVDQAKSDVVKALFGKL